MSAKSATLPAMCSATATAASLPLRSISPYSMCSMDSVSPSDRYSDVPVTPAAFFPAVTCASSGAFSRASSVVITLVVEAMGYRASSFCPNSTRPLAPSISTAPFAATVNPSDARPTGSSASARQSKIPIRFIKKWPPARLNSPP